MRRRLAYACWAGGILAAVLAMAAYATGGFRFHVFGLPISARGEHRAALFAAALALIGYALFDREWRILKATARRAHAALVPFMAAAGRRSAALLAWTAAAAAIAVFAAGLRLGVTSAGGSDSSGYLNVARQWRHGETAIQQEFARGAEWPDADVTFTPLGYAPAGNHTIVPTYSPGLGLLLAGADAVFGACGPFRFGAACAALLVWMTYLLGARTFGRATGAMAALAVATSPMVLLMSMSVMSDLPAAAFWTASLVFACRRTIGSSLAAGVAAGMAIVIRANLLPLALFPAAIAFWPANRQELRAGLVRACAVAAGTAPFVFALGWMFKILYGSPLRSGYGSPSELFDAANVWPNLVRYPRWLWETQGPVPFLFVAGAWLTSRGAPSRLPALLWGFAVAVFAAYVFYAPFDAWWYLRFLLTAFPVVFVLAFAVAWRVGGRFGTGVQRLVAVIVLAAAVCQAMVRVRELRIVAIAAEEQKYADAARYAAAHLPSHAIVVASQHSGSVRLYTRFPILRYDLLDPAWLDRALAFLRAKGFEPFLLGEDWELDIFRKRFADQANVVAATGLPIAELPIHHVRVYRLDGRVNTAAPSPIPPTTGCATR
jgi:dolichyl-phosphate-mannose-protein mannosyltransferase